MLSERIAENETLLLSEGFWVSVFMCWVTLSSLSASFIHLLELPLRRVFPTYFKLGESWTYRLHSVWKSFTFIYTWFYIN